jgi:hypothetical protein
MTITLARKLKGDRRVRKRRTQRKRVNKRGYRVKRAKTSNKSRRVKKKYGGDGLMDFVGPVSCAKQLKRRAYDDPQIKNICDSLEHAIKIKVPLAKIHARDFISTLNGLSSPESNIKNNVKKSTIEFLIRDKSIDVFAKELGLAPDDAKHELEKLLLTESEREFKYGERGRALVYDGDL